MCIYAGNLLVDESFRVRVSDFGLARVMHDLHTLTGGLGTFQWMAPEVLAHQRYSEKADVYSFGIVLWECTARQVCFLCTDCPFPALSAMTIIADRAGKLQNDPFACRMTGASFVFCMC